MIQWIQQIPLKSYISFVEMILKLQIQWFNDFGRYCFTGIISSLTIVEYRRIWFLYEKFYFCLRTKIHFNSSWNYFYRPEKFVFLQKCLLNEKRSDGVLVDKKRFRMNRSHDTIRNANSRSCATPQGIFQDDYVIEKRRASSPPSLAFIWPMLTWTRGFQHLLFLFGIFVDIAPIDFIFQNILVIYFWKTFLTNFSGLILFLKHRFYWWWTFRQKILVKLLKRKLLSHSRLDKLFRRIWFWQRTFFFIELILKNKI